MQLQSEGVKGAGRDMRPDKRGSCELAVFYLTRGAWYTSLMQQPVIHSTSQAFMGIRHSPGSVASAGGWAAARAVLTSACVHWCRATTRLCRMPWRQLRMPARTETLLSAPLLGIRWVSSMAVWSFIWFPAHLPACIPGRSVRLGYLALAHLSSDVEFSWVHLIRINIMNGSAGQQVRVHCTLLLCSSKSVEASLDMISI